jgi:dolichyl-diphosphooligosaccharide--protein glycosyltransferase
MAVAYPLPHTSAETVQNVRSLLKFTILGVIAAAAIASRLFAVIRHESIIHEL